MTFQEAQNKFRNIVAGISQGSSTAEIQQAKADLSSLLRELPNTEEFDPIAQAVAEIQPELSNQVTAQILERITFRSTALQDAVNMLNEVSRQAKAQATGLSLEKSKLVIPTITRSVQEVQKIRDDVRAGRYTDAASKAESLMTLLTQVKNKLA